MVTGHLPSCWGMTFLLSSGLGGRVRAGWPWKGRAGSGGPAPPALLLLVVERGGLAEPLLEPGVLEVPVPQRPAAGEEGHHLLQPRAAAGAAALVAGVAVVV